MGVLSLNRGVNRKCLFLDDTNKVGIFDFSLG